jgi:hypothetical protein
MEGKVVKKREKALKMKYKTEEKKKQFEKGKEDEGGETEGEEQDDGKEGCVIYGVNKLGRGSR